MTSISVRNVSKTYSPGSLSEVKALSNVSIEIPEGEFVTVVGSNGSGKSTLLRAIEGSIPIDRGRIYFDHRDVTSTPEYVRKREVGKVHQNPELGFAPSLTLEENLAISLLKGENLRLRFALGRRMRTRVRDYLNSIDFDEVSSRTASIVGEFSGGQKQAVALLMALAPKPGILLLDEHTASLDPTNVIRINKLTADLIHRSSITTIMVSHRLEDALTLGDRLIALRKGEVVLDIKGNEKRGMTAQAVLAHYHQQGQRVL